MTGISGPCIFLNTYQILCTLLVQYRSAAIKHTGKHGLLFLQAHKYTKLREAQALEFEVLEAQEAVKNMNPISFLISQLMVSD